MQQRVSRSTSIGPILAIVGGTLLAIGSFLPWAKVSFLGASDSASGTEGWDGWVTLVVGVAALAAGLAAMKAGRRALAVVAVVGGLVGGGIGVYDALTAKDNILDAEEVAAQGGVSVEDAQAFLDQLQGSGDLEISISLGLYIVIAGGVLAIAGGALQMGAKGASVGAPAVPAGFATSTAAPPPATPMMGETMPTPAPPPAPPPP